MRTLSVLCLFALSAPVSAQSPYRTYVGEIGPTFVLLAWGSTDGANTIGRTSRPLGNVQVKLGPKTATVSDRNWTYIRDLEPDTRYDYQVSFNGAVIGQGNVRTWPARTDRLTFIAMGDWGNGSHMQLRLAEVLSQEVERRQGTDNPVRFVMSLGDTIYADLTFTGMRHSGARDEDWEAKFFAPYERVLRSIPFVPVLGNHDGNESEARGDLPQWLDNFFFPGQEGKPARWYQFQFGGLVDFFGLDSTVNTESGATAPQYLPDGPQSKWLAQALPASKAPWKILFFHHPPFNAGPRHAGALTALRHWVELASSSGVQVVFNGHEHNLQFSEFSPKTGNVQYVTSGSGGELRKGNIRSYMRGANITAWAAVPQFLVVEIAGDTMRITPRSYEPFQVVDPEGRALQLPFELKRVRK